MSDCKISIIVPVYNAQEWLQHCLDSIASQDFESWQAIIVDDGSGEPEITSSVRPINRIACAIRMMLSVVAP